MTSTTLLPCNGDGQLGVRIAGPADAEPLLLIHGVGMQSAAWEPQLAALAMSYRVYAVDMPGHGQSSPLATGASIPDYLNWLDGVLDCLQLKQTNLAGHSMGAVITASYATTRPEKVLRAALVNCIYQRSKEAKQAVQSRAAELRAGKVDIATPLKRWFRDTPAEQQQAKQVAQWLRTVDLQGYGTAYTAFAHCDDTYNNKINTITCPLLAITGDGDPNSTSAMSKALAEDALDGEAVIISEHRHMINITAPERVNAELIRWLQRPKQTSTTSGVRP